MAYELKGGEEIRNGKLYGWTGTVCDRCGGHGQDVEGRACTGCGGTGEYWGLMSIQPADLPNDPDELPGLGLK